jgi:hypothetical protein
MFTLTVFFLLIFLGGCQGEQPQQGKARESVLTQAEVIKIAQEYAVQKGINLKNYPNIKAIFDEDKKSWRVSFKMAPTPPGGYFDIIIDDSSGKVTKYWPGE